MALGLETVELGRLGKRNIDVKKEKKIRTGEGRGSACELIGGQLKERYNKNEGSLVAT